MKRDPQPRHRRQAFTFATLTFVIHIVLAGAAAGEETAFRLTGGLKGVVRTSQSVSPVNTPYPRPPLEGPLIRVATSVTDEAEPIGTDFYASIHVGAVGSPLPTAMDDHAIALLDSGASTHLFSYPDSTNLGFDVSFLTGNEFGVSGVGDPITVNFEISMPVGVFAHGLQDLGAGGAGQPSLMVGHGNFAVGVNSLTNYLAGYELPTLLGAPLLYDFGVIVSNSAPVEMLVDGERIASPSVTFFQNPNDPRLPTNYLHRFFIEPLPTPAPNVFYVPDVFVNADFLPLSPSIIPDAVLGLSAALYFTSSSMVVSNAGLTTSGQMLFDTGAQACILSELAAADLGLSLNNPDFEVEVKGISGTIMAPGFFLDSFTLSSLENLLHWSEVPVVIINATSPEGGTIFGVMGSNLLGNRDYVINTVDSPAHVDVFGPSILPAPEITDFRYAAPDVAEVDWLCEPAAPELVLQASPDVLLGEPGWSTISTGELPVIAGTLSVTGLVDHQAFRLVAPLNSNDVAAAGP